MLNFKLEDEFVNLYRNKPEPFGFNGLGKVVYHRTYSRTKEDGTQETWVDTCRRVIEGMYSIQKDHALKHNRRWNEEKAIFSAHEAFDRLFNLKWSPPGRGLWISGTSFVHERGIVEAFQNCGFISTSNIKQDRGKIFGWFMEMLMLGVGVGFDTRGAEKIRVNPGESNKHIDSYGPFLHNIPDTREGWAESLELLIESYLNPDYGPIEFNYNFIRPAGQPIKGFGGISSGSEPLIKLHERTRGFLEARIGKTLDSRTITDIFNAIGACVVSGNVRRSAEIGLGSPDDKTFLDLKNYDINPERAEWGWTSNNSILARKGMNYSDVSQRIVNNGEPGIIWLENINNYARMNGVQDTKDQAVGVNPCGEQPLYHKEMCTLVELYPTRHEDLYDFTRSIKFAYLYGKTITLLSEKIKDKESREIMMNNRRIGLSQTGVAQFVSRHGVNKLIEWSKYGYDEVCRYDRIYSNWLGVPESIRKTSLKPSGTVSLLAGVTPGVHYPRSQYYIRRMRIAKNSDLELSLRKAGYHVEDDVYADNTSVVEFPVSIGENIRGVLDVSIWEQMSLAAIMQEFWSDNCISITVSFDPDKVDTKEIESSLEHFENRLKTISMLPEVEEGAYQQMPYEEITKEEYEKRSAVLGEITLNALEFNNTMDDKYCDSQTCEVQYNQ